MKQQKRDNKNVLNSLPSHIQDKATDNQVAKQIENMRGRREERKAETETVTASREKGKGKREGAIEGAVVEGTHLGKLVLASIERFRGNWHISLETSKRQLNEWYRNAVDDY